MNTFSPVAIIAAECHLPGGKNRSEFWSMVREGRTAIDHVPAERFNRELYFDPTPGVLNKTYTDLAALIDYPPVDRSIAPVPDNAESLYDIVHLSCADTVARACRSMGIDPKKFPIRNTGIFIGHTRPGTVYQDRNYQTALPEAIHVLDQVNSFNLSQDKRADFYKELFNRTVQNLQSLPVGHNPVMLSSDVASLIQTMLKTDGPGMVFNSACASSLHSIMQAALALNHHRIDMAITGGSSFFHSDTLILFASSRSMTKKRSCPFDADADGLVVGEGNVIFLMKRLEDAIAANDPILGVLTGVGVASDGKGKSLWAPRKEGQIEAVRRAYSETVLSRNVDYIEAHATSTALGDATELEALGTIFADPTSERTILLGSAKGNVGHTLEVAGATGVLKALLALENGVAPPVGGLKTRNPKIPWDTIPFVAPMQETPLPVHTNRPRRAAVNSFGIGGLNVHLVLDEYVPDYWKEKISKKTVYAASVASDQPKTTATRVQDPLAVVGLGCILPDAYSTAAFWNLLAGEENAFRPVPKRVWNLELFAREFMLPRVGVEPHCIAGVIDQYQYDWKKNKVPPKQVENASPIQFMMLDAVNEALSEMDLTNAESRRTTGVIVGTLFGGDFSCKSDLILRIPEFCNRLLDLLLERGVDPATAHATVSEYATCLHKKMPTLLDETGSFTPSALASRITKTLDLMGGAVAVESESGSFGAALLCAADQLNSGLNKTMIVIGGQQDVGPCVYRRLFEQGQLGTHPELSPFDAEADGYVPGEGCGVLVLKRLSDAQQDGDKIHAVIHGIGAAAGPSLYANVIRATQRSAANGTGKRPDLVEAPLLSLQDHDTALFDAFYSMKDERTSTDHNSVSDEHAIRISGVENRIGFFSAGSAAAACIKAILQLEKQKTLPMTGLTELAPCFARYADLFDFDSSATPGNLRLASVITGDSETYTIQLAAHGDLAETEP
ncbi:MAG: beta-ketoacyl synthase N-terminal-like domain-containing protein [Planctomycetia bacterium]|nr:beta-ketoacyl synthase N-terminal-like domain-containing protein [Planctomycetia bacterium]